MQGDTGILCQILNNKYLNTRRLTDPNLCTGIICSSIWKSIAFGSKLIAKGLIWRVGYGTRIRFWLDSWVPGFGTLQEYATIQFSDVILNQTVDSYISNGDWQVNQLALVLPWEIVVRIISIHAGKHHSGGDRAI